MQERHRIEIMIVYEKIVAPEKRYKSNTSGIDSAMYETSKAGVGSKTQKNMSTFDVL